MKNSIILFLILVPAFLFAQYPATGNKSRLGYQTTGDGLIWRGVAADTAIKPRTTANAYFQLDTVSRILRRYIATQGSWQVVGGGTNVDSLIYATRYWVGANFFPLEGGTLTGTGGAGFIGFPSQVTAPGTPASGLNVYAQGSSFNWKGTDGFERLFASTLTGGRTYTLPDISGTFAFGTGTADRSARWTATNTLAAGNITDNGTKLQALLPWQFQTYTTAGLPTGVTGYTVYETTKNGPAWYQGSRWAYGLESTFNRGTATRVPFFDANGQVTDHAQLTYVTGTPGKLIVPGGTASVNGIEFFGSDIGAGASGIRQSNNFIILYGNSGTRFVAGNGSIELVSQNGAYKINGRNVFQEATGTAVDFGRGYRDLYFNPQSGATPRRINFYGVDNPANTKFLVESTGFVAVNGNTISSPRYQLDINSTDAIGLPRGTVAQRPTIVASTTPFRYNTDSTALEYGESVGTWRQLATRAYARSLVSALPTTNIYTADGTLTSNRTITSGGFDLRYTGNFSVGSSSAPARTLDVTGEVRISDLTTDTPTRIVGADADGDLGELSLSGLSITSGVLTAQSIYNLLPTSDVQIAAANNSLRLNSLDTMKMNHAIITTPGTTNLLLLNPNIGSTGYPSSLGGGYHTVLNGTMATTNAGTGHIVIGGIVNDGLGANFGVALGYAANIGSNQGVAIGYDADATGVDNSMAIGYGARADEDYEISLGSNNYGKLNLWAGRSGGQIVAVNYGTGTKEAADLSKTQSAYIAGFATDGTLLDLEQKRDTTIFLTADTDYDFSAAVTTAQISRRYNRIIIHMTLTSGAGADKTTTLHTPDANLMQCEILIRGTDNTGTYDNEIAFGTNNAISSDGTDVSGYTLAQGQGLHVRVVYNGSAYKYIYY